jgi:sterol desaturase/sphingolipid hydroxylase (fatty acid hydroxylase superfamily)
MSSFGTYLSLVGSIFLTALIFYPFELLFPAEKKQPWAKRLVNLLYVPVLLAVGLIFIQPLATLVAVRLFEFTGGGLLPYWLVAPQSFVHHLGFAFAFVLWWDLWQYWCHRLQHAVPLLWETHRFHHSETALNSTTTARHHVFEQALTAAFYLPVLLIVGGFAPHWIVGFVLFRVWGFVNHANLRIPFGPLTPVISGPQWHRIHHSALEAHRHRNFAVFFPFIDIIFGTYYRPLKGEYPPTGLMGGEKPKPWSEATVGPLVSWAKRIQRAFKELRPTGP